MIGTYDTHTPGDPLPEPRRVEKKNHLTLDQTTPGVRRWRIDGRLAGVQLYNIATGESIAFSLNPLLSEDAHQRVLDNARLNKFITE